MGRAIIFKRGKAARRATPMNGVARSWTSPAGGFTLIEMMAVLLIMAALSSIAAFSLSGTRRASDLRDVVGQWTRLDEMTRQRARRFEGSHRLEFDLDAGTLRSTVDKSDTGAAGTDQQDRSHEETPGVTLILPRGFRWGQVRAAGCTVQSGRAVIACSKHGLTPSYAASIEGPKGLIQWVLVVGLTGRFVEMSNEREAEETLRVDASAAAPRGHTD